MVQVLVLMPALHAQQGLLVVAQGQVHGFVPMQYIRQLIHHAIGVLMRVREPLQATLKKLKDLAALHQLVELQIQVYKLKVNLIKLFGDFVQCTFFIIFIFLFQLR